MVTMAATKAKMMVAGAAAALLVLTTTTNAFDTGTHNDITRNVLANFGYTVEAQHVAALGNWFTDAYAFAPEAGNKISILPAHLPDLEQQHCNNLYSVVYAANYIAQHTVNSRNAIQDAARRGDTLAYLAILGTTVHTYQDFYAHSNWADLELRTDCDCYNVNQTFFSVLVKSGGNVDTLLDQNPELGGWQTYSWLGREYPNFNVYGGGLEHGGYCDGVNHDSYVRPHYEEAHAFALAATVEWIYNAEQWASAVNPSILQQAKAWLPPTDQDAQDLWKNVGHAYEVSFSATQWFFGQDDGHWKGPGSGSLATFAASATDFARTKTIYTEMYTRKDNPVWGLVTQPSPYTFLNTSVGPDGAIVGNTTLITQAIQNFNPFESLPANITDLTAIVVRTLSFQVTTSARFDKPDPWAMVEMDGFAIKEAPIRNTKQATPYWTAIKFVPSSSVNSTIKYTLTDASDTSANGTTIPISSSPDGALSLTFTLATNIVSGPVPSATYNTSQTALTSSQDGSSVQLYIDTRKLKCTSRKTTYVTYCPNTAFGDLGVSGGCDGSKLAAPSAKGAAAIGLQRVGTWSLMMMAGGVVGLVLL
ncbi:hypothetical protein DFS34DRAFT_141436 [Phlyctochytrium arcticum]|nr:hypothetical protein DFS34DRAFT_141436 [Phlyctochytrium arcticum]